MRFSAACCGSTLRTPFQVLADLTDHGDADDLAVWHEWEYASKGRRQLTWSQGIRAMAGLAEEERSDEEIAEDDLGADDLLVLDRDTWNAVAPVQIELLEAAADGGVAGSMAWLDRAGLSYTVTPAGHAALACCAARTRREVMAHHGAELGQPSLRKSRGPVEPGNAVEPR